MNSLVPRGGRAPVPTSRPRARRSESWMLDQLPVGMLDSDFFVRFVRIFQDLGSTLLEDADNVDNILDVAVAPDALVRYLGSWIGSASVDPELPVELQRRIVRSAAETLTWRGTPQGLARFLELASGGPVSVRDGGGVWVDGDAPDNTAWVVMSVRSTGWMPEKDFVELVRDEVPAHVRAVLYVGERIVWRSNEDAEDA
ncbi:phage tail protein [Jatrophihabitans fulvus]